MLDSLKSRFERLSFRWKAIVFIASVEGLFNILFAIIVVSVMQNNLEEQFFKRAKSSADTFATTTANAVLATDIASLESFAEEVLKNPDLRYIRISDTTDILVEMANDPELLKRPFSADTSLRKVTDDAFDTLALIQLDGQTYGRIEIGLSTDLLGSTITAIQLKVILIGISEILFSAFVSFLLGSFLVRRLVALQEGANRITHGDIGFQVEESGQDEIAKTAAAFNEMSRKTAELIDALQQALKEVNFQKFAMDQHAIVSIADVSGNITYVNDKFCESSGYSREELEGQNHRIIKSNEHSREFFEQMWQRITQGEVWHGVTKNRAKDGSHYWVDSTIVPFLDESGAPFQYVAIRTDITQRVEMERSLHLARQVAEEANRAKSEFLAMMSHEIRTPMNGVIGMTGLLLDTDLTAEQRHFAEAIRDSGDALLLIINDILDYSKIEANRMEFETHAFSPLSLVEGIAEILAPKAHEKGLQIDYLVSPDLRLEVLGDSGRLRQVLMNLVGNAIKFTERGSVIIELQTLTGSASRVGLRCEVRDTGIGIADADLGKLFSHFTQVDASMARKYGGTGLGLSISRQIIEAMGGTIGVDSVPGQGSTFWVEIELPLERRKADLALDEFVDAFNRSRFLVVSDSAVHREIMQRTLAYWSINTETAAGGEAARTLCANAAVEKRPYDLILTDDQMSGMDGTALIRELRQCSDYRDTPIVVISTLPLTPEERERLQTNAFAVLTKPVRHSELFNALITGLGLGRIQVDRRREPAPAADTPMTSLRILVADDNPINQKVAKSQLEKLGHQVDLAANGLEALEAARNLPYDLIFMDMQMPEMDGLEATRSIRRLDAAAGQVPIIALTANATREDEQKCLDAGMNGYLSKPTRKQKLMDILKTFFPHAAPA